MFTVPPTTLKMLSVALARITLKERPVPLPPAAVLLMFRVPPVRS
jgi:hypothetical protein